MRAADWIAAVATPPGRGAIGVVRISGAGVNELFPALLGRNTLVPREATLAHFLAEDGKPIDIGLALYFPAPHSYTGEDVLELQGHGGPAVLALLIRRCVQLGARIAEPGEFTRRAYLNDRMDLLQAEAVADLIEAGSESAARSALRSLEGEFSKEIRALVAELTGLRTLVEACIDFPEEDVELLSARGGFERLARIRAQLEAVQRAAHSGRLLREGAKVVLCGQPNVGKSTLLNRLAGEDVAIVSDIPGTTRDTLRESILIQGIPLQILDTAGLRMTEDAIEQLGVERTWRSLANADVALLVVDARTGLDTADLGILESLPPALPKLVAYNKADLLMPGATQDDRLLISALDGFGLDRLKLSILDAIGWQPPEGGVFAARERHLAALSRAARSIDAAQDHVRELELFAEELRQAQQALGEITGEFTADDLLGEIFSRFCIGK